MTWTQIDPAPVLEGWSLPASDRLWTDGESFIRTRVAFDAGASEFGRIIFRVSGAWANADGTVRQIRGQNAIETAPRCLTVQADAPENIGALKDQAAQETVERVALLIAMERQMEGL
jgi:hypothetical protein